jgi:hypothetical protein
VNLLFLDRYSFLIGLSSFLILALGLFHFDKTVAQKWLLTMQYSQYQQGDPVGEMRGIVSGWTEKKMLILKDIEGTEIVTDIKNDDLGLKTLIVLKGKIGEGQVFYVDDYEAFPYIKIKIMVSLLALLFLAWSLFCKIKVSAQGLTLPAQHS